MIRSFASLNQNGRLVLEILNLIKIRRNNEYAGFVEFEHSSS
jgi:hypothetical protein